MKLHPQLQEARFVARPNRFTCLVTLDGREVVAHVANSGRIKELLRSEHPMYLAPAPAGSRRKTAYDLALVKADGVLVSANAHLPNALLREAIEVGRLPAFAGYDSLRPEVKFEDSRVDFLLSGRSGLCYIEAKSVTLVEDGVGLFPDAPTERGRRHVLTLCEAVRQGHRAAVVFVVQRPDADSLSPNCSADPEFCRALVHAGTCGVEVYAYRCQVSMTSIELADEIPVNMAGSGSEDEC